MCNKVDVPNADITTPSCHQQASHLSPVKGELQVGSKEVLFICHTLGFHHLEQLSVDGGCGADCKVSLVQNLEG